MCVCDVRELSLDMCGCDAVCEDLHYEGCKISKGITGGEERSHQVDR